MKRILSTYIICLLILSTMQAQNSITVTLDEAGTLATKLTRDEAKTVVNLTITGKMDARDFKFLRDSINYRSGNDTILNLDISNIFIAAYTGKDGTFNRFSGLKDSVISYPENTIPEYSFTDNQILKSILLPNNLSTIGKSGFKGSSLRSISFSNSVTSIENEAFSNCSNLIAVSIPFSVTSMGNYVFRNCGSLNNVNIAANSTGNGTFFYCKRLKTVTLQPTVTTIGDNTFERCDSIANIELPSNISAIGKYAFRSCGNLKNIDFPASLKHIDTGAFFSCNSLFLIRLRSSQTKISDFAFWSTNLQSIYSYSSEPVQVDSVNVFDGYRYTNTRLHVAPNSKQIYENHAVWSKFKYINDDAGITFTVDGINYNVSGKDSVFVAYGDYSGEVSIPENVNYAGTSYTVSALERYAFAHSKATKVVIPATVTKIEDGTFINSQALTNITIPSKVTSIGNEAFSNCIKLQSVLLPPTLVSIGYFAFQNCESITELVVPEGVEDIPYYAFTNCKRLKSITLSSTIKGIGMGAFADCISMSEVSIPESVQEIASGAFSNCDSLKTVSFSSNASKLNTIGEGAFKNCKNLTNIYLPSGLDIIYDEAFAGCVAMSSFFIPASVHIIENNAFFLSGGTFNVDSKNKDFVLKNGILCRKVANGNGASTYEIIKCPVDLNPITITADMTEFAYSRQNPFVNCKGNFVVENGNPSYQTIDGVLYNKDGSNLIKYPRLKSGEYTILPAVKEVRIGAFYGCKELTKITIPSTLDNIGAGFGGCSKLNDIYVKYVKDNIHIHQRLDMGYLPSQKQFDSGLLTDYDFTAATVNLPWEMDGGYVLGNYKKLVYNQFSPWGVFRAKKSGNAKDINIWEAARRLRYGDSVWIAAQYPPTIEAQYVLINNGFQVTVTDSLLVKRLVLDNNSRLTINSNARLYVEEQFSNSNALQLLSDQNGTATFIGPIEDIIYKYTDHGQTYYRDFTQYGYTIVQQYLTSGRNWYISSPVTKAKGDVFNASDATNTVYSYDETKGNSNPWSLIKVDDTNLAVGKGYVYSPSKTGVITFNGILNHRKDTVIVTRTAGNTYEGYNLIGNPFTAYFDWSQANTNDLLPSIWYKTVAGTSTSYLFQSYNVLADVATKNGTTVATKLIPPMQAFWVRVADSLTTGKVVFDPEFRAFKDVAMNKLKAKSQLPKSQPILRLDIWNGSNSDQAVVYINANASNKFDKYDTPKMRNNSTEIAEIFTLSGNENVAINGLNSLPYDAELPIGFTTSKPGSFTIKASEFSQFETGTMLLLKDNVTNTITDLSNNGSYTFGAGVSNTKSRFALLFRTPASTINTGQMQNAWITQSNGMLHVNGEIAKDATLEVYNFMGQQVVLKNLHADSNQNSVALHAGAYIVTLTQNGEKLVQKFILN